MENLVGSVISRHHINENGINSIRQEDGFSPLKSQVKGSISDSQLRLESSLISKTIRMKQNNLNLQKPIKKTSKSNMLRKLLDRMNTKNTLHDYSHSNV